MVSFNKLTRTLAGIAAAALIVPLAACGGSGNGGTATAEGIPAKGTDDGTEITLWTRSPLERQAKNVVEAYNKSHKNQVKLEIIPNDDMEGKVGGASQTDCLSILIQTCSCAVFDGRFLFHRVPSPAGWLRRWLRGCHPPQA